MLSEHEPLLSAAQQSESEADSPQYTAPKTSTVRWALPIPLLAALGMAATSATSVQTFAQLSCSHSHSRAHSTSDCTAAQKRWLSGTVAVATITGAACSIAATSLLRRLLQRHVRWGLAAWVLLRSMAPLALLLGYLLGSLPVALASRLFEGLANDNVLHFALSLVYMREPDPSRLASVVRASLALFMLGVAVSPFAVSLLPGVLASFVVAVGIFAAGLGYVATVPFASNALNPEECTEGDNISRTHGAIESIRPLFERPAVLLMISALLVCNSGMSYLFEAILIFTTSTLDLTGRDNGLIVSLASTIAPAYLMLAPYLLSKLFSRASGFADFGLAAWCLFQAALGLLMLSASVSRTHVLSSMAVASAGLAAPPLTRSGILARVDATLRAEAAAAIAWADIAGALVSPVVMGGVQTTFDPAAVLHAEAAVMAVTMLMTLTAWYLAIGNHAREDN